MGRFLDKFPKVPYDITRGQYTNFDNVTDLTFRFSIIKEVLDNISAYYEYAIKEDETPEILADRVYGNPEAYWIILYANDIYDPQYDWPMNQDTFEKYIIGKYGSIAAAKSTIHHYEKIIARQAGNSETVYIDRQTVSYNSSSNLVCTIANPTANATNSYVGQNVVQFRSLAARDTVFEGYITSIDLANSTLTLALSSGKLQNQIDLRDATSSLVNTFGIVASNNQEYSEFYLNLPQQPQYVSYTLNNKQVVEAISRNEVSCYDYELEQNEKKRLIKVIKKEYYGQIMNEFAQIAKTDPSFLRRLG